MTKSIIDAHKLLNVQWKDEEDQKLRDHEFTGIENISYAQENMTILLEICKFFGRDVNIKNIIVEHTSKAHKKHISNYCKNKICKCNACIHVNSNTDTYVKLMPNVWCKNKKQKRVISEH